MPFSHPFGLCIVLGILIYIYVSTIEVNAWPSCPTSISFDYVEEDLKHELIEVKKLTESPCFPSPRDPDKVVCAKMTNITTGSIVEANCIATCTPGDGAAGLFTISVGGQEKRVEPGNRLECSPPSSYWPTCPGYEYSYPGFRKRIDGPCFPSDVSSNKTLVCYMITDIKDGSVVKAGCIGFCRSGDGVNGSTSFDEKYARPGEPGQRTSCSPLGNASMDSLPTRPSLASSVADNLALVLFLSLTALLMNSGMYSAEANDEAKEKRRKRA